MGFVCITTPHGTGAISLIEVLGDQAVSIVSSHFRNIEKVFKSYHGYITKNGTRIDEVLVRFIPENSSFTGLSTVEISCHGNPHITRQILELFKSKGLGEITHTEYLDLALSNKKIDKIQHEAYLSIQNALTRLSVMVLNDQINGALSKAIESSSEFDFLFESARFGLALTSPLQISIIGAPNVGKSSLFNKLLDRERALVFPEKGTTRDPVKDCLSIDGIPFLLCDTAGVQESDDVLEKLSIDKTMKQIQGSDLLLFVFDSTRLPEEAEIKLMELVSSRKVIRVLNKIDLGNSRLGSGFIRTSALTGEGINELRYKILEEQSLKNCYIPGSPVLFTKRQVEIIKNYPPSEAKTLLLCG